MTSFDGGGLPDGSLLAAFYVRAVAAMTPLERVAHRALIMSEVRAAQAAGGRDAGAVSTGRVMLVAVIDDLRRQQAARTGSEDGQ
ncbi:MAG TPA: hypothetical protein VFV41_10575 [Streptosporangiaceae bacterium]|nr:hypothetical protein [Streptosporangiaceae bacterium]